MDIEDEIRKIFREVLEDLYNEEAMEKGLVKARQDAEQEDPFDLHQNTRTFANIALMIGEHLKQEQQKERAANFARLVVTLGTTSHLEKTREFIAKNRANLKAMEEEPEFVNQSRPALRDLATGLYKNMLEVLEEEVEWFELTLKRLNAAASPLLSEEKT